MKVKLLVITLLLATSICTAQAVTTGPAWPNAFLNLAWNWTNPGKNAIAVSYAHKTSLFNGSTNFPVYSYTRARGYTCLFKKAKVGTVAQSCTDTTTGGLFPVYDRTFGGLRVTVAVVGELGATQTPTALGYTFGTEGLLHLSLPKRSSHWGLLAATTLNKSSVGGQVTPATFTLGPTFNFKGF